MGGIRANNIAVVNKAFKQFMEKDVPDAIEPRLISWCDYLLMIAIMSRLHAKGAHNITGNLLNSICVGLYRQNKLVSEHYAASHSWVKSAVRRKMTKNHSPYFFKEDYDGLMNYLISPNVHTWIRETNESHGSYDARQFLWTYKPSSSRMFSIVVAYTVEYADEAAIDLSMVAHAIHDSARSMVGLTPAGFSAEFKQIYAS